MLDQHVTLQHLASQKQWHKLRNKEQFRDGLGETPQQQWKKHIMSSEKIRRRLKMAPSYLPGIYKRQGKENTITFFKICLTRTHINRVESLLFLTTFFPENPTSNDWPSFCDKKEIFWLNWGALDPLIKSKPHKLEVIPWLLRAIKRNFLIFWHFLENVEGGFDEGVG